MSFSSYDVVRRSMRARETAMSGRADWLLMTRREAIGAIFALSAVVSGCVRAAPEETVGTKTSPPSDPGDLSNNVSYEDNVDALLDVFLPADRDATGVVTSPGARELQAGRLFGDSTFIDLATGLGLLPALKSDVVQAATAAEGGLRTTINALLDVRAAKVSPLTKFSDLTRGDQLSVIDDAYGDDTVKPLLDIVRVIAFVGYLGALYADDGLVAIGFPHYEDFANGIAVSGYPRTTDGRLIDATTEDLGALAASGKLDDYTYNATPAAFSVALGLDANGDLP
jgi:hypothetical protein